MICIPLPVRNYNKEEVFELNLELDHFRKYKIAVLSIIFDDTKNHSASIGTLYCNAIDSTINNPDLILPRFMRSGSIQILEWYKMDLYNLRFIRLRILGLNAVPLAVTIGIDKYGKEETL